MHLSICIVFLGLLGVFTFVKADEVMSPKATLFSGAAVFQRNQNGAQRCLFNGYYHRHGEVFSIPGAHCIKYICWYGNVHLREEGCQVNNSCYGVQQTFEHQCVNYMCHKSTQGNFYRYQPIKLRTRCVDASSRCRDPGSRFPFIINGRYSDDCTCSSIGDTVHYRCTYRA